MFWKTIPLVALCTVPMLFALTPQKRVSEKKQATFEEQIANANKAWAAKSYGTASRALEDALEITRKHHREAVMAAMPVPPSPWVLVPNKDADKDAAAVNAMFGGGANMIPVEVEYKHEETGDRLNLSVMVKSPMIQTYSMMLTNPAFIEKGAELIEYNEDKGLLKTTKRQVELNVVLDGESLLTGKVRGDHTGDFMLEVVNQAAVDRIKAAIQN